ncbi:hypothetical protein V3C99_003588 [Haemonchus contortus]
MDTIEDILLIFQSTNNVSAAIVSVLTYGYMIRRILTKHTSLTHYQNLLVAQASVYIFGSAVRGIVNLRVSLSLEFFYCYAGTPLWIVTMFRAIFNSVVIAEITMMLLFTIYRLLHCFKPKQTWLFYFVVIPIAFLCVVSAGVMSVWRPEIYGFCMLAYLTAILLITSSCYFILRRHFRLNKYSILVRKMQNKLSKGVLFEVAMHLFMLMMVSGGRLVMQLDSIFTLPKEVIMSITGIYDTTISITLAWYPVAIGFIIKWSISGFLTSKTSSSNVRAIVVADRITTLRIN